VNPLAKSATDGRAMSLLLAVVLAVSLGACAKPKPPAPPAASEPPKEEPAVYDTHVSYCRSYADRMAGRELQREYDTMEGRFRGGESRVFRDFAEMDARKNYRRIYENCIRDRTANEKKDEEQKKGETGAR